MWEPPWKWYDWRNRWELSCWCCRAPLERRNIVSHASRGRLGPWQNSRYFLEGTPGPPDGIWCLSMSDEGRKFPPDTIIRRSDGEHYGEWIALWAAYNAFYGRTGETALPEHINRLTWDRLHSPDEPMLLLVASDGKQLVGFAHLIFHRSTIAAGVTCYLQDLFVSVEARGRRIGEELIAAAAEEARAAGSVKLYWQTHESNLVARGLYDRIARHRGFLVYDIRF